VIALCAGAAPAAAGTQSPTTHAHKRATTDPNTPVLVSDPDQSPKGYRLTGNKVERIAAADPTVRAELKRHPQAIAYEYTKGPGRWQVSWFSSGRNQREIIQVYIADATGTVTEAWTGYQVPWIMARGYPGAFGRRVNAWYIWVPLCLAFVLPFLPWRKGPDGRRRLSLLHLDLLMLLGFSISLAVFNHANIGLSVPLVYPFLVYLLVRMLLMAFGRGRPRSPLPMLLPVSWLAVAAIFLVGFRVGLNVTNSNVIDVGYAGVIGADKLLHGKNLYGHWPSDNAYGDTYGPVAYYAYVPFRAIFGWGGHWDSLPAAHAAAIAFDLLMLIGLFFLGRMVRGPTLGILLVYLWAAYPFTLWTLNSNTNDTLVGLLVVAALLCVKWAPARGGLAALAGLTKFAPFALGPLLLRGLGGWRPVRSVVLYVLAYAAALAAAMLPVILDHNLWRFWHDTFVYQFHRPAPFSIWGLWSGLSLEQHLMEGATAGLAIAVAFVPRRRGLVEIAALGAAVLIALQLSVTYWLYSYIVWFFPLVIVALFGASPRGGPPEVEAPAPQPEAQSLEAVPA
jgi:hypothetical protein